jgi:hypothetical protein
LKLTESQLTKIVSAVVDALTETSTSRRATATGNDRSSNIRAAIRSGKSKSAVRRQFKLTDYEYRGHKATVTRMANGN